MKNIIITSGNCIEAIDSVRNIVNSSSGKLGSLICEEIVREHIQTTNDIINIYYICSRKTIKPHFGKFDELCWDSENNIISVEKITPVWEPQKVSAYIHIIKSDSAQEIYNTMKELLTDESKNITHVIHARAISDYMVDYVTSSQKIDSVFELCDEYSLLKNALQNKIEPAMFIDNSGKISSDEEDLIVRLIKTPKIISYIKRWKPDVKLFGFKLLDSVSQDELLGVARKQMEKCNCDFVVANDISQINNSQHIAHIISSKNEVITCNTKQEIAETITRIVMQNG